MALALALTGLLYLMMRRSRIGRAIVAVRMDSGAAALMGIKVDRIYAITFGIGALMAGAHWRDLRYGVSGRRRI